MSAFTPIRYTLTKLVRLPLDSARNRRASRVGDLCIQYLDGQLTTRQAHKLFAAIDRNPNLIEQMEQVYEVDRMLDRHYAKSAGK